MVDLHIRVLFVTWLFNIVYCVDGTTPAIKITNCFHRNALPRVEPRPLPITVNYSNDDPIIQIQSIVDEIDIHQILTLTECIQDFLPDHFEFRPFDLGVSKYGGGNNVTYVGGIFQILMPEFILHMKSVFAMAVERAGWYPHTQNLGIRCIETLVYGAGGELLWHTDADSIYTVVVMLSDLSDFEGGNFAIRKKLKGLDPETAPGLIIHSKLSRGNGVMFDSNKDHGVEHISRGKRRVLVFELWPYQDSSPEEYRPGPETYTDKFIKPSLIMTAPMTLTECVINYSDPSNGSDIIRIREDVAHPISEDQFLLLPVGLQSFVLIFISGVLIGMIAGFAMAKSTGSNFQSQPDHACMKSSASSEKITKSVTDSGFRK